MNSFERIDTPSGHILVCLLLVLIGAAFHKLTIPKADDLIVGGSGALMMAMRSAAKNGGNPPEAKA